MEQTRKLLWLFGTAFLIAGLALGLIPISIDGIDCGSAFINGDSWSATDCALMTGGPNRGIWAFALMAFGAVLWLGSAGFDDRKPGYKEAKAHLESLTKGD